MSTPVNIVGGKSPRLAYVSPNHGLYVAEIIPPVPDIGVKSRTRLFAQYAGTTGALSEGTPDSNADQGVDGSVTNVEFFVGADQDFDIRVMGIAITIADTAVAHNAFANVNALTNGWDLSITEAGEETFIIKAAKTGGQLISQGGFANPYGDGVESNHTLRLIV